MDLDDPDGWRRLALLADPVRRRAYALFQGPWVLTREQVADRLGITPALAGHHLGKLVAAELLERAPGVSKGREGRPPATYRRGRPAQLPGRRPEVLTDLLAGAGRPDLDRVREAARARGRAATPAHGGALARGRTALQVLGFAPRTRRRVLDSGGCPFATEELQHPEVACEVALSLAAGVAEELGGARVERVADGPCCVRLRLDG